MNKILELFTSCIGEKISDLLEFNDSKQALKGNWEELIAKESDIQTKVNNAELSGRKRRSMEVGSWLKRVEKFKEEYGSLNDRLEGGGMFKSLCHVGPVKKLKERAAELIKKGESFRHRELVVDACGTSRERLFTTRLHGEQLKQELDNVLAWVRAESDQVSIIGIHGMAGVGKTTLAKHIYESICSDLQGPPHKFLVYKITISQEANIEKMQNDLAKEMNFDLPKQNDVEQNAAILHEQLAKEKNVVLILDDVWKFFHLEKIGIVLGVSRCKVIITSRLREVCDQMGCKETIKVQPLSDTEAWELFLEKLGHDYMLSPEVKDVAKKMAKKCDGLPLAMITVARSMIGVDGIHGWRDALEELKESIMAQTDMNREVLPVLLYSYNRLREKRLQQCFLYCSLYPEDYQIPRDELISLFISEGLMHRRDSRAASFDQGHVILDKLVMACLLEKVVDLGGEDCVKMHDLVREMAVEITRKNPTKFARKLPDEQEWDLDKVSLHSKKEFKIPEGLSPISRRLSTLILSDSWITFIPDSFFASMPGLRVLDLRGIRIEMLPNSISELENLNALLLGGCYKLSYIPSLRKLRALTELDMSGTSIRRLPEGIECLVNLKCLDMNGIFDLEEIPRGLLPLLHGLQRLTISNDAVVSEEVESLKMLEEFESWVVVDIFPFKWLNKSPPFTFYRINFYRIEAIFYNPDCDDDRNYERAIALHGCTFKTGGVDVVLLPQNIQYLKLDNCKGLSSCLLEDFPSLCHSKDFRQWTIDACEEIESIMRIASSSTSTCNDDAPLQNLKRLEPVYLPNLIELIKWEPRALAALPPRGTFSSLTELCIEECHKMKKLFPHRSVVHNLQNLEVIAVSSCDQMEEIIGDDEEDESIRVGSTSNTCSVSFPKLRYIGMEYLPELYSICNGEMICCDSIEGISIRECPKLKRLPLFHPCIHEKPASASIREIIIRGCTQLRRLPLFLPLIDGQPSPPPSLEVIWISAKEKEWWESLEWDHLNSNNLLRPFL